MSEWRTVKLADAPLEILDGDRGKNYPSQDEFKNNGYCLFLSTKNVRSIGFDFSECQFISKERDELLRKGRLKRNDVVLTTRGTVGNLGFFNDKVSYEKIRINSGMVIIRPDETKLFPAFNFYTFRKLQADFLTFTSGSAQPQLPIRDLKEIEISIPLIEEQKAIASVLSSLDDKIDLLQRQNTTLERMAETLFRQWFVEEAQEDWEFVELGTYVDCFNGVSYKSSELNPSKVAMVTLKSFDRNGGFRLDGFKEFTGRFKEQHVVIQGDLVVAHTDITQGAEVIGNPVLVVNDTRYDRMVISMDLVKVKSKYDWISNEFLYRMMRTREFKEHCLGYSNGSTVLHLSKQAIPSFDFFMPPKEKIQSYTEFSKDLFGKKFKNIEQILTLEKLRDNLLSKLMSGEVRVEMEGAPA